MAQKTNDSQELGKRIEAARKEKNMTSSKLAGLVGVTQGQISNYENGRQVPSAFILTSIADSLGVSLDYLLGRESRNMAIKHDFMQELDHHNKEIILQIAEALRSQQFIERAKKPIVSSKK